MQNNSQAKNEKGKGGKVLNIVILILLAIAVILSYIVFQKVTPKSDKKVENKNITSVKKVENKNITSVPKASLTGKPWSPANFASEEEAILNPPQDGTAEDYKQLVELANRIAKDAPYLDISNCNNAKAQPLVLRVKLDTNFTVVNNDKEDHKISILEGYNIPSGGKQTIKAAFDPKKVPGLYSYSCDGKSTIGMLFVVK